MANLKDNEIIWDDDVQWEDSAATAPREQPKEESLYDTLMANARAGKGGLTGIGLGAAPNTREGRATGALMAAGALTGGMAPLYRALIGAGTFGTVETTSDVLENQRSVEDLVAERKTTPITPASIAGNYAEGLAYEALPFVGGKVANAVANTPIAKSIYRRGIGFGKNIKDAVQESITNYGLKNNLVANKKTLTKVETEVKGLKEKVNRIIDDAAQKGETINPEDVLAKAQTQIMDKLDRIPLVAGQRETLKQQFQEEVKYLQGKYGVSANGRVQDISIKEAQKIKEDIQGYVKRIYGMAQKAGANMEEKTLTKLAEQAAIKDAYKKEIAGKVPVDDLNKEMSKRLAWRDFAQARIRGQSARPLLSHDLTLPAIIELSTRGRLGVPTALGGTRMLSTHPTAMTRAGIYAKYLENLIGAGGRSTKDYILYPLVQSALEGEEK